MCTACLEITTRFTDAHSRHDKPDIHRNLYHVEATPPPVADAETAL
jgi:hypothetical protein